MKVTDNQARELTNAVGNKATEYCKKLNREQGTHYKVGVQAFTAGTYFFITTKFFDGEDFNPKGQGKVAAILDRETGQFVKARLLKKGGGTLSFPKNQPKGMPTIDSYSLNYCGDIPQLKTDRLFVLGCTHKDGGSFTVGGAA